MIDAAVVNSLPCFLLLKLYPYGMNDRIPTEDFFACQPYRLLDHTWS